MNLWKKFESLFNLDCPLVLTKEMEINTDLIHLKTQTKAELEKLGRKLGMELDKRLTKDKLIKQIRKHSK